MSKRKDNHNLTSEQVRAARDLLDLSGAALARLCKVPRSLIYKFETTGHLPQPMFRRTQGDHDRMAAIRSALEAAGVEFTEDEGVRLARPTR